MIQLNGHDITPYITRFPDGCSQVWKLPKEWGDEVEAISDKAGTQIVRWYFESESEFISLLQLLTLLCGDDGATIELHLPYLPYGRQDKAVCNGMCFGLWPFLEVLPRFITSVRVFDPHSTDAFGEFADDMLFDGGEFVMPDIEASMKGGGYDTICFPDAGAVAKYLNCIPGGIESTNVIHGHKVREQETGKILSYEINGMSRGKVLVVDDICDGGATFLLLAEALAKQDPESVDLYVSHGVFSKGQDGINALLQKYDRVICTDSRPVAQYTGLTVLPCPI